jgi:hypothetical protein
MFSLNKLDAQILSVDGMLHVQHTDEILSDSDEKYDFACIRTEKFFLIGGQT